MQVATAGTAQFPQLPVATQQPRTSGRQLSFCNEERFPIHITGVFNRAILQNRPRVKPWLQALCFSTVS
jgi:hypothetical protein